MNQILPMLQKDHGIASSKPKSAVGGKRRIINANNNVPESHSSPRGEQAGSYLTSTFQQQQRAANINVPDNASKNTACIYRL